MKRKNILIKYSILGIILLTIALGLSLNLSQLMQPIDSLARDGMNQNGLAWDIHSLDLLVIMFFLISGALCSVSLLTAEMKEKLK